MSLSPLGVSPHPALAHYRYKSSGTEVLCAITGPYESRGSKKAQYTGVHLDVVISALLFSEDTSETEELVKACLETVIAGEQYPYLTLMVCVQVIHIGAEPLLPAALNAAYRALLVSGLVLRHGLYAEDVEGITLTIVPNTDLVVQSFAKRLCSVEELTDAVKTVYQHSKEVPLPEVR